MNTSAYPKIIDPVYKPGSPISSLGNFFLRFITDERDLPFVRLCLIICLTTIPAAIYLFIAEEFNWWLALLYFLYNSIFLMGPYILMLHNVSHRMFFKRKYNFLNRAVTWIFGPLFGETPESYFAHHLGMHHPENNLSKDLSSTMKFQRDSIFDFMRYFTRFFVLIVPDLSSYLKKNGRVRILRRLLIGESTWYILIIALMFLNWEATLVVFVIPVIFTRFMMMAGNWAQHAFIDLNTPDNCFRNSITCINSSYNKKCFNDGYHIGHHLHPSMHWTEMPVDFKKNIDRYAEEKAIVFQKLDYFLIWFLLMTKNYKSLSKYFVDLSPEKRRTNTEIISMMKERVRRYVPTASQEAFHTS